MCTTQCWCMKRTDRQRNLPCRTTPGATAPGNGRVFNGQVSIRVAAKCQRYYSCKACNGPFRRPVLQQYILMSMQAANTTAVNIQGKCQPTIPHGKADHAKQGQRQCLSTGRVIGNAVAERKMMRTNTSNTRSLVKEAQGVNFRASPKQPIGYLVKISKNRR